MARVYVSSTIADLTEERQAALNWLRLARHQAVDSYLPDSDTVRDSCLDDIAACDLYVLILGHRYGFQPPEDNPEGLSITHLEFRRAGLSGIPRIALLRTSIPDVSLSDLADPRRLALVSAFREEVAREVRAAASGHDGADMAFAGRRDERCTTACARPEQADRQRRDLRLMSDPADDGDQSFGEHVDVEPQMRRALIDGFLVLGEQVDQECREPVLLQRAGHVLIARAVTTAPAAVSKEYQAVRGCGHNEIPLEPHRRRRGYEPMSS